MSNVVVTDIKHSYFCQLPNTAYLTDIAQVFMKTDLWQTCLFSDKSTNEQQVWVTVRSLQYSSFLLPSSRAKLRMSNRCGWPCGHCCIWPCFCFLLRRGQSSLSFLLKVSWLCLFPSLYFHISGQSLFIHFILMYAFIQVVLCGHSSHRDHLEIDHRSNFFCV